TATPAWDALRRHHDQIGNTHLRQFFADDPGRGRELTVSVGDDAERSDAKERRR
ncbi:hypothetical protein BIS44_0811, partial [Mycobacterium tuberculosis variant bovis BCG]